MTRTKQPKVSCSNCGAPFHGVSTCKPTVDGNNPLYVAISDAADALVDLMRLAEARNQPSLLAHAGRVYPQVLDLRGTINPFAQPKEGK